MTENMHTANHSNIEPQSKGKNKEHHKKRSVIRRLILILGGLILGLDLYFANAGGILGNQLPMPFGYGLANVLSGSMEPTFSKGTLLLVKDTRDVQVGDIVVYQSEKQLIVHRVVMLQGDEIMTQGDANNAADMPFDKSQIKGKVIGWLPLLGTLAALLKTPAAVVIILILAFVLVEGSFRNKKEADDQEMDAIKAEIRRLKAEIEDTDKKDKDDPTDQ